MFESFHTYWNSFYTDYCKVSYVKYCSMKLHLVNVQSQDRKTGSSRGSGQPVNVKNYFVPSHFLYFNTLRPSLKCWVYQGKYNLFFRLIFIDTTLHHSKSILNWAGILCLIFPNGECESKAASIHPTCWCMAHVFQQLEWREKCWILPCHPCGSFLLTVSPILLSLELVQNQPIPMHNKIQDLESGRRT